MADQLESDLVAALVSAEEIVLETQRANGQGRRTPIWVVLVDGAAYVRSWHGARGAWYRDLQREPAAVLHLGARATPVRAAPVHDPETIQRVSEAYLAKYNFSPYARRYARELILPEPLSTTTQLLPRP